jgi:raffinose/stachyose/melibiose transport system permease protein
MNTWKSNWKGIILFLLPISVMYITFFIYPFIFVFISSLTEWSGISAMDFHGLDNYRKLLQNSTTQIAIRNNIFWALSLGFLQVGFAAIIAFILARKPIFWRSLRTIYFVPKVISMVAIAMLWKAVYNAEYGALNAVLSLITGQEWSHNWLGSFATALPAIIAQEVMYIGYFMIIIVAGVMAIPKTFYEAAEIDGASVLQQERLITLPMTWGIIVTAMTLAMAYGLRHFEATFLMTGGGPGHSTTTLALAMYDKIGARHLGQASTLGTILVVIGFTVIVALNKTLGRKGLTGEDQ